MPSKISVYKNLSSIISVDSGFNVMLLNGSVVLPHNLKVSFLNYLLDLKVYLSLLQN